MQKIRKINDQSLRYSKTDYGPTVGQTGLITMDTVEVNLMPKIRNT